MQRGGTDFGWEELDPGSDTTFPHNALRAAVRPENRSGCRPRSTDPSYQACLVGCGTASAREGVPIGAPRCEPRVNDGAVQLDRAYSDRFFPSDEPLGSPRSDRFVRLDRDPSCPGLRPVGGHRLARVDLRCRRRTTLLPYAARSAWVLAARAGKCSAWGSVPSLPERTLPSEIP